MDVQTSTGRRPSPLPRFAPIPAPAPPTPTQSAAEVYAFDVWEIEEHFRQIEQTAARLKRQLRQAQLNGVKQLELPVKIGGQNAGGLRHRVSGHANAIRRALRQASA